MRHGLLMMALLFGCPPADDGDTREEEQTSTGGEGETTVVVERVDENEPDPEPEPTTDATTCTSQSDCAEGQLCAGEAGCDSVWTCQDPRPCTRDLVTYCACSGETVQGSGSCPPEPYERRGACD